MTGIASSTDHREHGAVLGYVHRGAAEAREPRMTIFARRGSGRDVRGCQLPCGFRREVDGENRRSRVRRAVTGNATAADAGVKHRGGCEGFIVGYRNVTYAAALTCRVRHVTHRHRCRGPILGGMTSRAVAGESLARHV